MSTAFNIHSTLWEALDNDLTQLDDPGANGTIRPGTHQIQDAYVVLASAGTNAFESAALSPKNATLTVFAQASVTVNGLALADGEFASWRVTLDSNGAHQWSLIEVPSTVAATTFATNAEIGFGDATDVVAGFESGDASNHTFVIGLDDVNETLHITDKAAISTDWNISAFTHPTVLIHSNTTPATDYISIGNHDGTTAHIDVVGGTTLSFDVGGTASFTATATRINVADSVAMTFGTHATGDITMAWDGTDFDVLQATANSSIKWGVDGAGIDQVWYGDTASNSMTWDQSDDALEFTASATISGAGGNFAMFTPSAAQEENPAAGAISVTTFATQLDTAGPEAFTLANGGQKGQLKFIHMTVDGGDATLTATGFTSIVFSNIGDAVLLRWDGTAWVCILRQNLATAAITTPVLTP